MRGNKNKGIVKVLGIGLTAAVLSFTLTGVAENAVTGAVSGKSVSDGPKTAYRTERYACCSCKRI